MTTAFQTDTELSAGAIYAGPVMHSRLKPFTHRFQYKVFTFLVDLDRLAELDQMSALFSVNRNNLVSFHEGDHVDGRVSPPKDGIRTYINRLLSAAQLPPPARVFLLAYPRVLGHAFNPISLYYCYDTTGQLSAMIYEVRNTFGERHAYVCTVEPGQLTASGLRQSRQKNLHVSPFLAMNARYEFRLTPPGDRLNFRILETDDNGPLLAATFSGRAEPLTTRNLILQCLKIPLLGIRVVTLIHFEALRLWLKGALFRSSPPPPEPASTADGPQTRTPGE